MNYSEETIRVYEAMSTEELFDFTVIHHCPYSWNLGDYIPNEVEEWILEILEKRDKVGIIEYLSFDGASGERNYFFSKEDYLQELKKQLYYNPDGIMYITLLDEPDFLKSVDDLVYGSYGCDNPHSIEHYKLKKGN